jgi:glycosyltransferase involved in cell wall biosynthesis
MHKPLVTIGIPCYNAKDSVKDAIEAALKQDYPNVEVLVVDDCSTDGSQTYLQDLKRELNFNLILLEKNGGVAKVCNTIIAHAKGEYIAFCGDDDMFVRHRISEQVKQLTAPEIAQHKIVASFVARTQVFPDGREVYEPAIYRPDGLDIDSEELLSWTVLGRYGSNIRGSAGSGTCLAHRSVYQALNGYDENFRRSSDMEFVLRLALLKGKVVTLQESLLIQRMTAGADKTSDKQRQFFNLMLEKHQIVLKEKRLYRPAKIFSDIKFSFLKNEKDKVIIGLLKLALTQPASLVKAIVVAYQRRQTIKARQKTIQ